VTPSRLGKRHILSILKQTSQLPYLILFSGVGSMVPTTLNHCRAHIWTPFILGQQLLWTEQSDPSNLDSVVWPRAAASAEVFWTGPTLPDGSPLSVKPALARLHDLRYRMLQRGIKAIALQPYWCALRPGFCDLDTTS